MCLAITLLVMVLVGNHMLNDRDASGDRVHEPASEREPVVTQEMVYAERNQNLVYRLGSIASVPADQAFGSDPKGQNEGGDILEEEEESAIDDGSPAKPLELIKLLPAGDYEDDPFLQASVVDPGDTPFINASSKKEAFRSNTAATSKASKAIKAGKLEKLAARNGLGRVTDARDKAGIGSLADLDSDASLEPETVEPQAQLNSFYEALKDPNISTGGLRKYMDNLTTAEIPVALEALHQQPHSARTSYASAALFASWGKTDPLGALDYADEYESIRMRNSAISTTLGAWAKERPHEALGWYLENLESDPRAKQVSVGHVFRELAKVDMNDAIVNARALPDERMRRSAFAYILEGVDRDQRDTTLANLYQTAVDSNERKEIANMIVRDQVRYQPYEAAQYVTSLDDPEAQRSALSTLVETWSQDRPDQTVEFVNRINDAELREKYLGSTMRNWVRYDPAVALNWLGSQPPSSDLDSAYSSVASNFRGSDPQEALYWAEQIQDQKQQTSSVRSVAKEWMKTDPEQARAYIATSALFTDKDRAQYLGIPILPKP
ncbi:MAG: hypothetical protein ACI97B_002575 [Verrucomicrobiales bacterium]|jgi:hypothetical protein